MNLSISSAEASVGLLALVLHLVSSLRGGKISDNSGNWRMSSGCGEFIIKDEASGDEAGFVIVLCAFGSTQSVLL